MTGKELYKLVVRVAEEDYPSGEEAPLWIEMEANEQGMWSKLAREITQAVKEEK